MGGFHLLGEIPLDKCSLVSMPPIYLLSRRELQKIGDGGRAGRFYPWFSYG